MAIPKAAAPEGLPKAGAKKALGARADLVYGTTGSLKTTQIGWMARYVWKKYKRHTRLVSCDLGGWQPIQHEVNTGLVDAFLVSVVHRQNPLSDLVLLTEGWWPENSNDLASPLQPPTETTFKGDGSVGAYGFEGLTSISTMLMGHWNTRHDIHIPGTPKDSFVQDGDKKWGFSSMSHYGFTQRRVHEMVSNSSHLPVAKVLWTAHETDAKEDKRPIYGPALCGDAMTSQVGGWFGAMLHMAALPVESIQTIEEGPLAGQVIKVLKPVPLMFLRDHIDPKDAYGVPYKAKPRGPMDLWKEWPDWMEPRIDKFYEKLDGMEEKLAQGGQEGRGADNG